MSEYEKGLVSAPASHIFVRLQKKLDHFAMPTIQLFKVINFLFLLFNLCDNK